MILTIVVFLVILSILVIVHEFGHFIVGRWAGIGVLEFALGLPFTKPLWTKKLGSGMHISLYPILFGGFVKLLGEEGAEEKVVQFGGKLTGTHESVQDNLPKKASKVIGKQFYKINVWQRIAVVVAGVVMNLFLAVFAFYIFLALSGFKVLIPKLADYKFISPNKTKVIINYVQKDSPADVAKIIPGDVVEGFSNLVEFQNFTKINAGKPIKLILADRTVEVTPRVSPPPGQGALGVAIAEAVAVKYETSSEKIFSGVSYTADMFIYNIKVLGHLGNQAVKNKNIDQISENISGPVGIAGAVSTILAIGGGEVLIQLLNLLGLLSLSLAFMNILPIPALDGGRLAFLLVEAIFGKKLAAKKENLINQFGMALLLGLIILVSFNDIKKAFGK